MVIWCGRSRNSNEFDEFPSSIECSILMRFPPLTITVKGLEPFPTSPDAFGNILRTDIEKWAGVIKTSGAKPE